MQRLSVFDAELRVHVEAVLLFIVRPCSSMFVLCFVVSVNQQSFRYSTKLPLFSKGSAIQQGLARTLELARVIEKFRGP